MALKTLVPERVGSEHAWRRLVREARVAASLRHPGLVQVHELVVQDDPPYLVMELVRGSTLAGLLGRTPRERLLELLARVARAVHFAHERGLVHRDLKPANVLVEDGSWRPVVTDFGLVAELEARGADGSRLTPSGVVVGTPPYMSPEQAAGQRAALGPPSDVWSLGVILYEVLCGVRPFQGATLLELLLQVGRAQPVPPSRRAEGVPPSLEAVCLRALSRAPGARPSALELAGTIERELARAGASTGELPPALAPEPAPAEPRRASRTLLLASLGSALGLVALGALAAVASLGLGAPIPEPPPADRPAPVAASAPAGEAPRDALGPVEPDSRAPRGQERVLVGLVSTGLDPDHPALAGRVWVDALEVQPNREDDDPNGAVDDAHGWNLLEPGQALRDDVGLGTHLGRLIAGTPQGGERGGACPGAHLLAVRVEGQAGRAVSAADLARGIVDAARRGVHVLLVAVAPGALSDRLVAEALQRAARRPVLVIVPAGPAGRPAGLPREVVVVASRSTPGTPWTGVDLVTRGRLDARPCPALSDPAREEPSVAAAQVAGAAAVLLERRPGLDPGQVRRALLMSASPLAPLVLRHGELDLQAALRQDPRGWAEAVLDAVRAEGPDALGVWGTAEAGSLQRARLEVARDDGRLAWEELPDALPRPVRDGRLGSVSAAALQRLGAPADFWLRLVVEDQRGLRREARLRFRWPPT